MHLLVHCRKYNIHRLGLFNKGNEKCFFAEMAEADKMALLFQNVPGQTSKYIKSSYNLKFCTIND